MAKTCTAIPSYSKIIVFAHRDHVTLPLTVSPLKPTVGFQLVHKLRRSSWAWSVVITAYSAQQKICFWRPPSPTVHWGYALKFNETRVSYKSGICPVPPGTSRLNYTTCCYLRRSTNPHNFGRSILHCCWSTSVEQSTTSSS